MNEISKWISTTKASDQVQRRLICFHYAGGDAGFFQGWQDHLPSTVQLAAVQLPGRWSRYNEPPFTDMATAIGEISNGLDSLLNLPYAVLGYSVGAKIAYEWIRNTEGNKKSLPFALFAMSSNAPSYRLPNVKTLSNLNDEEFIRAIVERYDSIPPELLKNKEFLKIMLRSLRADVALYENYRFTPGPPFDFPIYVYAGKDDRMLNSVGLESWQEMTTNRVYIESFDGGHFFVEKFRVEILNKISQQLAESFDLRRSP